MVAGQRHIAGIILLLILSSAPAWTQKLEVPFRFEENRGQYGSDAGYIGLAAGYRTEMRADGIVIRGGGSPVHMSFAKGRKDIQIEPAELMAAPTDVYDGRTGEFYSHLRNYQRLKYAGVYPGIDVVFRGSHRALEFDFVLKPHADYKSIALDFSGQTGLKIADDGSLAVATSSGELRVLPPTVYQDSNGKRKTIQAWYVKSGTNEVRFDLDNYDAEQSLVIDPQLVFGTYLGPMGSNLPGEILSKLAMGPSGDAYAMFTEMDALDSFEVYISIVRFNGNQPASFYNVSPLNFYPMRNPGLAIAVDNAGNPAVLTSISYSCGNCVTFKPSLEALPHGNPPNDADVTIVKFGPGAFSTNFGGHGYDFGTAIAFDSQNNIYITGYTNSSDFPTQNAFQSAPSGGLDGFLAKIDPSGTQLLYSTYLGGSQDDFVNALALDGTGNMYVAGTTASTNLPVANAMQSSNADGSCTDYSGTPVPCTDMFVTKLNPAGTALVYSTYIGGAGFDTATQLALAADGTVFLHGTGGAAFPITRPSGFTSATADVLVKLDSSGSRLDYSMRFPSVGGITADSGGDLYIAGSSKTEAANLPVPVINSFRLSPAKQNMLVAKLDPSGNIVFSTLVGGTSDDYYRCTNCALENADAIGVDGSGRMFVIGTTYSSDFPVTDGSQPLYYIMSDHDAVIFALDPSSGTDASPRYSRIENDYSQIQYSGPWYLHTSQNESGGSSALATDAGAAFTVNFTGTSVSWYGCKDESSGIARVILDGVVQGDIDTYMTPGRCNALIWSASGLASGPHSLVVQVSGTRNSASGGNRVWLDKIEITSAGDASFSSPGGTGGGSTIALVQSNAVQGTGVASLSAGFPANNTAGNLIIALVRMSSASQTVTVTDSAGNTYTDAVSQAQTADGHQVHLFYAKNIRGGTNTVTARFSSTNNHPWLAVYEYSGLDINNPVDQTAHTQGSDSSPFTGLITTTSASELEFAATGLPLSFTGSVSPGFGYTMQLQDTQSSRAATESDILTSAGNQYAGRFTLSAGANWTAIVATFKAAGPGNPAPDFTLSVSPVSQTVVQGNSMTYNVSISGQNGFAGIVNLSVSGFGSGVSASFNSPNISGSGSSTLTVTSTSAAQTGTFTPTITASSGSLAHSAAVTLAINPATASGGIALVQSSAVEGTGVASLSGAFSANNTAGNLILAFVRMSSVDQTVTVTDSTGNIYIDAVSQAQTADGHQVHLFYAKNIRGGANTVTARFSSTNNHPWLAIYEYSGLDTNNPLDRTAHTQGSDSSPFTGLITTTSASELEFAATGLPVSFTGAVTPGFAYTMQLEDTQSSRAANETDILTSAGNDYAGRFNLPSSANWTAIVATFKAVSDRPAPDFTLSVSPASQTMGEGGTTTYNVSVAGQNGFTGIVNLSLSGLGSGVSGTFNPTSISGSGSSTLTLTASSFALLGTFTLTITGSTGSLSDTATATLTITSGRIALVQSTAAEATGAGTLSVTFPSINGAGNLIIAVVRMSTTTQTVTLTDSAGNAYVNAVSAVQTADGHQLQLFYAKNIPGGSNTVTAHFSSTNNHPWMSVFEYSGLSSTSPLDQVSAAQGSSAIADSGSTPATSSWDQLAFAAVGLPASYTGTVTAGSGFALLQQDVGASRAATEAMSPNSRGQLDGIFNLSSSTAWSALVVVFKR